MSQRVNGGLLGERFEEIMSVTEIASAIEAMPERYWELVESMMRVAFEMGATLGCNANPGETWWR